ncbi:MAG: winged helix-turn-helix domain-containing protein [Candidatus Thorarchaeota archaeon]|jgi:predicted transcriptional regulator
MVKESDKPHNYEEEVFKTLSHQIRRDILRFVGENKSAKFTEIKKATEIDESAALSYHLNSLTPLLLHQNGLYRLSDLGKDAYSLMNKLVTYSTTAEIIGGIKKQLGATIIANALLWASAIAYLIVIEGPLEFLTLLVFASLFSTSNMILYSIQQYTTSR